MAIEITTDVLIIGTGPAGSTCAALLATYGIECMAINRYRWLAHTPRAYNQSAHDGGAARSGQRGRERGDDARRSSGADGRQRLLHFARGRGDRPHGGLGNGARDGGGAPPFLAV